MEKEEEREDLMKEPQISLRKPSPPDAETMAIFTFWVSEYWTIIMCRHWKYYQHERSGLTWSLCGPRLILTRSWGALGDSKLVDEWCIDGKSTWVAGTNSVWEQNSDGGQFKDPGQIQGMELPNDRRCETASELRAYWRLHVSMHMPKGL